MSQAPDLAFENAARARGFRRVAGVDEVGRGPLSGPVVAAAVRLDPAKVPAGLNDSKKLTAPRRTALFEEIRAGADVSIAEASVAEIDALNILEASHLAMCRAIAGLGEAPDHVLIDGNRLPRLADLGLEAGARAIVRGDQSEPAISAASILAKTWRDAQMCRLHERYPGFGLDEHKGYPTRTHVAALRVQGPSAVHRRTFAPCRIPGK